MTHGAAPAAADTTSHITADAWTDTSTSHHDHSHYHHHHHHHHDHTPFPVENSATEQPYYPPPSYGSIMRSNSGRTLRDGHLNDDEAQLVKWVGIILLGTFLLLFGMILLSAECRKGTPWANRWC